MAQNKIFLGYNSEYITASIVGVAVAGLTTVGKRANYYSFRFTDDDLLSINSDLATSIDNDELKIDRFRFISTLNAVEDKYYLVDNLGNRLLDKNNTPIYYLGVASTVSYLIDGDDKKLYDHNNKRLSFRGSYWSVSYLLDLDGKNLITSDNDILTFVEGGSRIAFGTPIWYYRDNYLKGKFYLESIERIAENQYMYSCVSAMGLLANSTHQGGIYSNATISSVISDIVGDTFEYEVDPSIANVLVSGWLPYSTKRDNLHQLLFAYNIIIVKGANGKVIFTTNYITEPIAISGDYIYEDGSIKSAESIASVSVVEHAYISVQQGVSEQKLYDTTNYSGTVYETLVVFDEPIITSTLRTTGTMTVVSSTVNTAVVSGIGVLYGKPYTHVVKTLKQTNATHSDGKEVTVDSATLITSLNSSNVLSRLYEYYTKKQVIESSWVLDDEKCGTYVTLTNIYKEVISGYISKMSYVVSNIIKATAEIISGYTPIGMGASYDHVLMLTDYGEWKSPTSSAVRVILIGGGSGGNAGKNGNKYNIGCAGIGGNGAKVKVVTFTPSVGATYLYSCGTGGNGGTVTNPNGNDGTDTTFGTYSSSTGARYNNGYVNTYDGISYGCKGISGTDGTVDSGNAVNPELPKHYGDGGNGGNGGGKGTTENKASNGTNGNNGCIIIYYKET